MAIKGPATSVTPESPSVSAGIDQHIKGIVSDIHFDGPTVSAGVEKPPHDELDIGVQAEPGSVASTIGQIQSLAASVQPLAASISANIAKNLDDAETDWLARISGPGVVWYHNFASDSEVDQFKWTGGYAGGNDPTSAGQIAADGNTESCRRITTDGVTGGGCMEKIRPGTGSSSDERAASWWRPFNAFRSPGNGRLTDDPAASGDVTLQTWAPTDGGSQTANWNTTSSPGWYGHPDYHTGSKYDGHEFYLQMRIKMDPNRTIPPSNPTVGKLTFLTITDFSLSAQEIVTYSGGHNGSTSQNNHRMYNGAFSPIEDRDSLSRPGQQVGKEDADYVAGDYCNISTMAGNCWAYSGGWDTLLYHIVPGHNGVEDTRLVVYAANEGETEYTKIWDMVYRADFETTGDNIPGWNAIIASTYQNNSAAFNNDFYHRFDEIIFSKEWIPCPGSSTLTAPTWFTGLSNLEAVAPVSNWLGDPAVRDPNYNNHSFGGSHQTIISAWTGMGCDEQSNTIFLLANGGHNDYNGNEVYACDLSVDSPAWDRLRDSYWPSTALNTAKQPDGTPRAMHTSGQTIAAEGRWFMPGMTANQANGGGNSEQWWEFNHATNEWIDLGDTHTGMGFAQFCGTAYDPVDREIITVQVNNGNPSLRFTSIDDMTDGNGVLENNTSISSSSAMQMEVDTTNRILLGRVDPTRGTGSWSGFEFAYIKLDSTANKQAAWVKLNATGTGPSSTYNYNLALHWHEPSNAFLTWDGGNQIFKLTPTVDGGGNYTALTWSTVPVTGVSIPSPGQGIGDFRGMYNKVQLIDDMGPDDSGNRDSALVLLPVYTFPDIFVIRISGAI